MVKSARYTDRDIDAPMPLTCAYLKTLNQPELFEFRPRLGALAKMVLCGRRPWWQTQEQTHSEVRIGGIGRLLLCLAPLHPHRLIGGGQRLEHPDPKTALSGTGAQIHQG
jgi:hypothetical protein